MGGPPNVKLIVKLEGEAKYRQGQREGIYIIGNDLVSNRSHWVQEIGKNLVGSRSALWYTYTNGIGNWKIGLVSDLGSHTVGLMSKATKEGPEKCIWDFFDGKKWKSANMTITAIGK